MNDPAGKARRRSSQLRDQATTFDRLHPEVHIGRDLFRDGYYDESVRKAAQRFVNRVQERASRSDLDGTALMNQAFSDDKPLLVFNERGTRIERNIHDGYRFLAVGLTRGVRNVLTHHDNYDLSEVEAWEWLAFISAMHRLLDAAQQVTEDSD